MSYKVGDVVLVKFPWKDADGEIQIKPRPAIVLKEGNEFKCALIKITSKNRSNRLPGFWITKESKEGQEMGILMDSFINLTEAYWLSENLIFRVIGKYHNMDKIFKAMENIKIPIKPEPKGDN